MLSQDIDDCFNQFDLMKRGDRNRSHASEWLAIRSHSLHRDRAVSMVPVISRHYVDSCTNSDRKGLQVVQRPVQHSLER